MDTDTPTPTTCWECGTLCGALVTVREDRAVRVAPNPAHPASKGAFCVKGIRALPEWTYNESRLRHPQMRDGPRGSGRWRQVSWDDALDAMADGLAKVRAEHGPLAIAGAVSGGFFPRGPIVAFLMRSMGSPNWMINQDLCGGCRGVSDMVTGLTITGGEDIENTRCALIVGRNPQAADPIQWQALKRAKASGAKLVVIDPVRAPAAGIADLHLRPRPGSDAAVGLAMMHVLIAEERYDQEFVARWCHGFDELKTRVADYPPAVAAELSGVGADDIVRAARLYGDGPSTFISGHGIDAFSAGVQTFRAFHCLVAISGNLDRPGGNRRAKKPAGFRSHMELLHDPAFQLDEAVAKQAIGADEFPLWAGPDGWQAACHNPSVIEAMLTGEPYPVRALYATGVNIVVTYPDARRTIAALKSLDFFAAASQTMTPTAAFADIVLPKTTTLEEEEVSLHVGGPCITYTAAIGSRQGEARSDLEIACGLIDRLQARGAIERDLVPWADHAAFNEFLLGDSGIDRAALAEKGYATYDYALGDFENQVFRTPTGKVELYSERLAEHGLDPLPGFVPPVGDMLNDDAFPLLLLTGAREKTYHHSRFRDQAWARKVAPDPWAKIHPATAAAAGISEDDWVAVEVAGGTGHCRLRAKLTEDVEESVISTGMGWWLPEADGPEHGALDVNINGALSYGPPYDPAAGSANTRGLRCRVTRLASETTAVAE